MRSLSRLYHDGRRRAFAIMGLARRPARAGTHFTDKAALIARGRFRCTDVSGRDYGHEEIEGHDKLTFQPTGSWFRRLGRLCAIERTCRHCSDVAAGGLAPPYRMASAA